MKCENIEIKFSKDKGSVKVDGQELKNISNLTFSVENGDQWSLIVTQDVVYEPATKN